MSKTRPAPLPTDTLVGGYRIVRVLASGGFGLVYLARDASGSPVAIKEYLPTALCTRAPGERLPQVRPDRQALYRLGLRGFFEEARALAQIAHPAVVGVQHFFHANDTVYLVMEYLQGASLQDYIVVARERQLRHVLQEGTIRALFDEVLRGLRIVHQHGLLHLDIKPANILITDDDRAVLIDFGAARQALQHEGDYVRPMYTPGFAAPEMYQRGPQGTLGPWTDLYAIGACLYSCMVGYPPPDAPTRQQRERLLGPLARWQGAYSDNLREAVRWCMMLDPASRPQSVYALQRELAREDEDEADPPAPPPWWARWRIRADRPPSHAGAPTSTATPTV
ncbi:serine/threonine-protein kinase [Tepidimonas aquatica]|uniref:Serine/threonine-protein kinase D n=1 Tax=Tepidimonas aquatica TaxID=247482 RepID=A0A554WPQ6_9BURK|nr:serine/threonine-protein kinase [Tepidimonas aquatica]TSE25556.1 Serine/threonine-protein kinase D [Tepidimonas aquatica]